ncbi:hypothetical protein [Saccharopolyspora phatthalungensis]|uniref:Uncharacterized protein n=1 Tax=Saccharopolyspora phatthalungensis TaxID=664693 RepID=A0A840QHA0_9PSEU|nr:hypothetical protein [Saccharopolyspora phatthalungensis]MBB5159886.1 hypothetical protein [Saccharopolyspora phatthalungensis]
MAMSSRLSNVLFSLVVGLVLLFLGCYGRVSGGLPPDNPYRRRHPVRTRRPDPDEQIRANEADERERRIIEAEVAVAEGTATPEQAHVVHRERARRQADNRRRAHQKARSERDPNQNQV